MTLTQSELDAVSVWARKTHPLNGVYYRSVSFRHMDPGTVLDGNGTAGVGGRFASMGTRAVYLAESDQVASSEVTARKLRLGGSSQISTDKYPRIVFTVEFRLARAVDISKRHLPRGFVAIRRKCLEIDSLDASQQFGDVLQARGIDGMVFPSVVGKGLNLIVYKGCCAADALKLQNKPELMAALREISAASK